MSELELKFQVPAERRAALLRALSAAPLEKLRLRASYHDTEDRLLAANRLALRLRLEGRDWVQTLKGSTSQAAQRAEHNVNLPGRHGASGPAMDVARHAEAEVGQQLLKLLQANGEPALRQLYATDIWRHHRLLSRRGSRIEAAFDEGHIEAGTARRAVCEIEFELKSGAPAHLFELAETWCRRHGLWLDVISKAERGTLLGRGMDWAAPVKAQPLVIDASTAERLDARGYLARVLDSCMAQVLPNAAELAAGCDSADHVHQLRVGLRRLRTALRELGEAACFAPSTEDNVAFEAAFSALGGMRDQQALALSLLPRLQAAGAPLATWPDSEAPALSPQAIVREPAFQTALLRVLAFTHSVSDTPTPGAPHPRPAVAQQLQALHAKVARAAKRFDRLTTPEQHRVRKQLKRLRYLAEFAAPLYGPAKADAYLAALRPAQDALGEHNDRIVAHAVFERAAATDPRAWFAVGWLQAQREASDRACGKALRRIGKARRFWRKDLAKDAA